MSHTTYFIEVLKTTEAIEGATYLTDEEKSVFASRLLSELKPPMMTPGSDSLRLIVEKRIKSIITKELDNGSITALGTDVQRTPSPTEAGPDDEPKNETAEAVTSRDHTVLVQPRPPVHSGHGQPPKQGKGRKKARSQTRVHSEGV